MKRLILTMAAVAGVVAFVSPAWATSLAPGSTVLVGSSNLPAGGSFIASQTLSGTDGTLDVTLKVAVYKETSGNLDFLYQVKNNLASSDSVEQLIGKSFSGFSTNVLNVPSTDPALSGSIFNTTGTFEKALSASRSKLSVNGGRSVAFNFSNIDGFSTVDPGQTSSVLAIQTNGKFFSVGGTTATGGGNAVKFSNTFAPSPEPSSMVLLLGCAAGLGGTVAWRRWRTIAPTRA
jgi:hypothetical protein